MSESAETRVAVAPSRIVKSRLATSYLEVYPYFCAAPVGDPRSDHLSGDPVLGTDFKMVPFGGLDETGWSVWFFPTRARRDAFVRRYQRARHIKSIGLVTRRRPG